MLPGYEPVYLQLATAHLIFGQPNQAIDVLNDYTEFTEGRVQPSRSFEKLRSLVNEELPNADEAVTIP